MTNPHFQLYIDGAFCEGAGDDVMQRARTLQMEKLGPVSHALTKRMSNAPL